MNITADGSRHFFTLNEFGEHIKHISGICEPHSARHIKVSLTTLRRNIAVKYSATRLNIKRQIMGTFDVDLFAIIHNIRSKFDSMFIPFTKNIQLSHHSFLINEQKQRTQRRRLRWRPQWGGRPIGCVCVWLFYIINIYGYISYTFLIYCIYIS